MRATEIYGIKLSGAHANESFTRQDLRALVDENPFSVPPVYVRPEHTILINIDFNQGASTVLPLSNTRSMQDMMRNTPPQVDTSTFIYRDIRRDETRTVGERGWRSFTPVVPSRLPYLFAAKKTVQLLSQNLTASYAYARAELISEEDQKENGKQPKPGKLKPEKPKPERKGDKGSRRVKRPKVKGLVSSILQKSSAKLLRLFVSM